MVTVNGKSFENIADKCITEYLSENGYDIRRVAVEINGDIIPKAMYDDTVFCEGDDVEIVSFVGGG